MKVVFIILSLILCASISSAAEDTVLAKVGDKIITTKEFRMRYEFSPQVFSKSEEAKKKEYFLYTLIAEKLFAENSEEKYKDTSEVMNYTYNEVERIILRDALYKREITDKVTVTEDELKTAAAKEMYKLTLGTLFSRDSSEFFSAYNKLKAGTPFDSLSAEQGTPDMEIEYGQLYPASLEDSVYKLSPGEYTTPYKSAAGWYVFLLRNKKLKYDKSTDVTSVIKSAERKLREIKSGIIFNAYFNKFFRNKKIEADGAVFWSINNKISAIFSGRLPEKDEYSLKYEDLLKIEEQFGDSLSAVYINIDNEPVTIKSFLRKLFFQGFIVKKEDLDKISARLNASVKNIIENELLTAEAYRQGLDKLPEVRDDLRMWKESYLSTLTTKYIADSLIKSEVKDDNIFISLSRIITNNLSDIEGILNRLNKGEDFIKLEAEFNRNEENSPMKNASWYGEAGRIALSMNPGDVYGPITVPDGYMIFKLLEKAEKDSAVITNPQKSIFNVNLESLKKTAAQLADKYGVEINYGVLEKMNLTDHNMFTIRMMGFGGRIPAVPLVSPFYEWYELWQNSKKEVP